MPLTRSAVKLCRWSKTHLRGNGACYKHTFYGLNSASCMEASPSIACANRCLFCWRHHSNPTGRAWRWKEDSAEEIYNGMIANLSLVGEPIMYPHIADFIDLLHQ